MRHKYETRGIVLSRSSVGEASVFTTLITHDLGLVRVLTQGARKSGAKLAHALTTLAESDVVLVRGKDGWRLAGAVLAENWFSRLGSAGSRARAGRISSLVLRLVAGETQGGELYAIIRGFFEALTMLPEEKHEAIEILAVLRILSALGLDKGGITGEASAFTEPLVAEILKNRVSYIARINTGIEASGL